MMKPSKAQAKAFLQESLDEIAAMMSLSHRSTEFMTWQRNTQVVINNIFGKSSRNARDFGVIRYFSPGMNDLYHARAYQSGLDRASAILQSMITEVDKWWTDDVETSLQADVPHVKGASASNRVFVVHGRDEAAKQMVARYLEGLELEPVILQELPSEGRTIIEKFEDYAQTVGFAVILGTPDDVGALADDCYSDGNLKLQPRMRQNVVLELGYFAGTIGRKRVCALLKGDIERPSDYDGVIYIPMDDYGGWRVELAKEMRAAGLPVDMNLL